MFVDRDESGLPPRRELAFEGVRVVGDRDVTILDGVDLTIPLEGITVLAGPSGAGKSTLLRLCNRLDIPTEGRVLLDGEDTAGLDPVVLRKRVGMVFQQPVLFAGTVRDNFAVALPAGSDERFRDVLDHVGLRELSLDQAARDLSGGEAQRVCLARTMLTDPEVLLADEPTSSLDPASRRSVEAAVRRLADEGLAVIWVTHDMDQANRIADRKRVIIGGRIASHSEASEYVASASLAAAEPGVGHPTDGSADGSGDRSIGGSSDGSSGGSSDDEGDDR